MEGNLGNETVAPTDIHPGANLGHAKRGQLSGEVSKCPKIRKLWLYNLKV
jgi:hypothetical protein